MLGFLYFLPAAALCFRSHHDTPKNVTVLQDKMAALPCPHEKGDVSWSRFIGGKEVTLVTIKNGKEERPDKQYGSLADNSLVIRSVTSDDRGMYFCNKTRIYLEVTTDPNKVYPKAGNVPDPPRQDGQDVGLGSGQNGAAAAEDEDSKDQQASDLWKIPVGVVIGAALVLLVLIILRFYSTKRGETNPDVDKTGSETIYEEIGAAEEQARSQSDVESPYTWTSISETQTTSITLYSTVNKLNTDARSRGECVYYLAQNPPQTGRVG